MFIYKIKPQKQVNTDPYFWQFFSSNEDDSTWLAVVKLRKERKRVRLASDFGDLPKGDIMALALFGKAMSISAVTFSSR